MKERRNIALVVSLCFNILAFVALGSLGHWGPKVFNKLDAERLDGVAATLRHVVDKSKTDGCTLVQMHERMMMLAECYESAADDAWARAGQSRPERANTPSESTRQ